MSAVNVFDEYLGNVVAQAALTKAQFEEAVLKAALHVGAESVTIKWTSDDSGTRFDLPTVERHARALAVVEAARAAWEQCNIRPAHWESLEVTLPKPFALALIDVAAALAAFDEVS